MSETKTWNMEIVETVDGRWMILVNGFQWGHGPYDRSGCSSETWPTRAEAACAYRERTEAPDENR